MHYIIKFIGLSSCVITIIYQLTTRICIAFMGPILNYIMKEFHYQIRDAKVQLFEEAFEKVDTENKSGKLEILELGIGCGENFRCFPTNSNITVLDNTDKYLSFLKQSVSEKRDDLTVSNLIVNSAENMTSIESNSMDVVLHTFLLCSIADYNAAINEVYRVLK